jgi:hypothetical protein
MDQRFPTLIRDLSQAIPKRLFKADACMMAAILIERLTIADFMARLTTPAR